MNKRQEGFCPLCGAEIGILVSAYREHPFVDGRRYRELCFACSEIPKCAEFFEEYNDGKKLHREVVVYYNGFDQENLHTIEEMVKDGFNKDEAKRSLKAVKSAIKRGLKLSKPQPLPIPDPPPPKPVIQIQPQNEEDMGRRKKNKRRQNKYRHQQNNQRSNKPPRKKQYSGPLQTQITLRPLPDTAEGLPFEKVSDE